MSQTYRIAILLADENLPALYQNKQTLPILFSKFFSAPQYQVTFFNTLQSELPQKPAQYDACIITGSKHSVLNREPWANKLYDFIVAAKYKKLIGICYGHQMIALSLGGNVKRMGWHIGISKIKYLNQFKSADFYARFNHEEHVVRLPNNAQLLATSEPCANTLFQINHKILSMQFHPEFTQPYHNKLLYERFVSKLKTQELNYAKNTINSSDSKINMSCLIHDFISSN